MLEYQLMEEGRWQAAAAALMKEKKGTEKKEEKEKAATNIQRAWRKREAKKEEGKAIIDTAFISHFYFYLSS